jgi:hypothetical protein
MFQNRNHVLGTKHTHTHTHSYRNIMTKQLLNFCKHRKKNMFQNINIFLEKKKKNHTFL